MGDRVTAIKEYYTNLDYIKIDKKNVEETLAILTTLPVHSVTLSEKFTKTACIIMDNFLVFASLCKHIDMVETIIKYLFDIAVKMEFNFYADQKDKIDNLDDMRILTFLTLCNVCPEPAVQIFLSDALGVYDFFVLDYMKDRVNEMILLEDSDLDAVVSCLRIIENYELTKIWVHKRIKKKFLWLKMKYFRDLDFPIHTFQSKQELFTPNTNNKISIVSIWSEDIVAAKNLAKSLNENILFINTHMDFYDGVVLMPYMKISKSAMHTASYLNSADANFVLKKSGENEIDATCASKMMPSSVYNLFYDGKWQKSAKTTYYKCNDSLWANATKDDIQKCINSAQKGFEIWSAQSIQFRSKILHDLIDVLVIRNRHLESENVLFKHLVSNVDGYNKFRTHCFQRKRLELTEECVPLGIIILMEHTEMTFMERLLKLLITGNSIIILHNTNQCYDPRPYCDLLAMYGLPSGVINILSHEDITSLELYLCKSDYSMYVETVYSDKFSKYPVQSKQIILPLK